MAGCRSVLLPAAAWASIGCSLTVLQLSEAITLGQMLVILVASACLFWIGRIVEGYFSA